MSNPHINVFRPYEGSGAGHEDRLTRAALVVMKLVPLAEDAFLRLVAGVGLADVGRGKFDTQTRRLVEAEGDSEAEIERIVSVFLSPDESRDDLDDVEVVLEERGQRIDGTVRYEHHLVVAVESKLHLGQSDRQARHLSPEGLSAVTVDPVCYLAWHDLLERWPCKAASFARPAQPQGLGCVSAGLGCSTSAGVTFGVGGCRHLSASCVKPGSHPSSDRDRVRVLAPQSLEASKLVHASDY